MAVETREFIQDRLASVRAALHTAVDGLTEDTAVATSVTPEWTVLDGLRHIAAWQDVALAALERWTEARETLAPDHDPDPVNARLLAERQHMDLPATLARIEANLARFAELLRADDATLAVEAEAPWGGRVSRLKAISGILWHDGEHLREIAEALND